ncbi:MAG: 4Fe-4S binding protein [Phycisphaerae bacterium]|jgi:NAD-dependent dihydropyrimidine dehydrogenase PreA subunit|nr:4Fe-4S binding protein [Phycisphaerae bacterium]
MAPYGDGTGPAGRGPGTVRGRGRCGYRNQQSNSSGGWWRIFNIFRRSRSMPTLPSQEPVMGRRSVLASVDLSRCTHCGVCADVCPVSAILFSNDRTVIDPKVCIGCGQCVLICPKDAIRLMER